MPKNGVALTLPSSPDGDPLRPGDMQEVDYEGIPLCITHRPGNSYTAPSDHAAWLPADISYGYISGTTGPTEESEGIPVLVRIDNPSDKAFTVALTSPDGTFWGHMVLLGFDDSDQALSFCQDHWGDSTMKGSLTELTLEDLDDWVQDSEVREQKDGPNEEDEDYDEEDSDEDDLDYDEDDSTDDRYEILEPEDLDSTDVEEPEE